VEEGDLLNPSSAGAATTTVTIILHLGVNYKGTAFQIERCGYNEADFRVPDERGAQPRKERIVTVSYDGRYREVGEVLATEFDVPALVAALNVTTPVLSSPVSRCSDDEQQGVVVRESSDPGRFVCNFTYFLSLDRCQKNNSSLNGSPRTKARALFLHVPPFDQIPEPVQLEFIARLMEGLRKQVLSATI
jgi:pyroglutamyl-peptidase